MPAFRSAWRTTAVVVLDLNKPDNITRVAAASRLGTLISGATSTVGGACT